MGEIKYIVNDQIKIFVIKALQATPDYFFTIPSSSTGKYHPNFALGEGGLVRHTRACARIAIELFRLEMFNHFTQNEKDIILASLILHDTYKKGNPEKEHTIVDHPIFAKNVLLGNKEINNLLSKETMNLIVENIARHMGQWNTDYKTGNVVLEKPTTKMQNFVHMVDYLASRKCLEMNFDVELSK